MNRYKELKVWQKSIDLVLDTYKIIEQFPKHEQYVLIDQMRRSAISIPSNIAEGAGRATNKDFSHFISIATESSFELETQLIISERLNYLDPGQTEKLFKEMNDIQNMLFGLQKSLGKTHNT